MQYGFEALMANEFYNLSIECVPPNLVPQGPTASAQYQSCTLQGSQQGSTVVSGSDYIRTAFTYERAHLWRNFGIITAFWIFFVILTMLGMELQKPNAGGGAVTIFKRGQAPKSVEKAMDSGDTIKDEEKAVPADGTQLSSEDSSGSDEGKLVKGVARNESIFTYQNVNYIIPYEKGERQLLRDVQGYVRPGKLTALMGASGAGKSTLLNTLAQRINFGVVTGDFLVDGRPLPNSFQRATGFAEQMDVHEPTATVREALRFSARLRQPKEVPIEEKYEYCERIIDLLEMRSIAGATIGKIGEGLNQEQRKRVTIGVELASKPELLLFLDEPTSGLDSGAAFNIVRFLRKLADSGQALLVTIHQPSSVLFEHFDELLLLKSGGRIVYHGPLGKDSRQLINYFENNGAKKCEPSANPAEYMLEAIGAGDPNYKGQDWGDIWASSPEHQDRAREIQAMIAERRGAPTNSKTDDDREFAMPLGTQVYAVVKRSFVSYWRTPDYMIGKFVLHIFVSPPLVQLQLLSKASDTPVDLTLEGSARAYNSLPGSNIFSDWVVQLLYLLPRRQLANRHAITSFLRFHDSHHFASAHPTATTQIPQLPQYLPIPRGQFEDLQLGCSCNRGYPSRTSVQHPRWDIVLRVLVVYVDQPPFAPVYS